MNHFDTTGQFRQFTLRMPVKGTKEFSGLLRVDTHSLSAAAEERRSNDLLSEPHTLVVNDFSGVMTLVDWHNGAFVECHLT